MRTHKFCIVCCCCCERRKNKIHRCSCTYNFIFCFIVHDYIFVLHYFLSTGCFWPSAIGGALSQNFDRKLFRWSGQKDHLEDWGMKITVFSRKMVNFSRQNSHQHTHRNQQNSAKNSFVTRFGSLYEVKWVIQLLNGGKSEVWCASVEAFRWIDRVKDTEVQSLLGVRKSIEFILLHNLFVARFISI